VPGWATIVVVVCFLGGAQLMVLGIVGEYVNRIYDEVKNRPLYVTQSGSLHERAGRRVPAPLLVDAGSVDDEWRLTTDDGGSPDGREPARYSST